MRWVDVKGYEDIFSISEDGQLYSKRSGKILKQHVSKEGYNTVSTRIGGRCGVNKCFRIHRLVAEAFLEDPSEDLADKCSDTVYGVVPVNHKDGDKLNNHYTNLEWCDHKHNTRHWRNMRGWEPLRGENHPCSKITKEEAMIVKDNYEPYSRKNGLRAWARRLGVSHASLSSAIMKL